MPKRYSPVYSSCEAFFWYNGAGDFDIEGNIATCKYCGVQHTRSKATDDVTVAVLCCACGFSLQVPADGIKKVVQDLVFLKEYMVCPVCRERNKAWKLDTPDNGINVGVIGNNVHITGGIHFG